MRTLSRELAESPGASVGPGRGMGGRTGRHAGPDPVWEIGIATGAAGREGDGGGGGGAGGTLDDGSTLLGYITGFGDLYEVLEVVAPYDLAYQGSYAAAVRYFEALAHGPVTATATRPM